MLWGSSESVDIILTLCDFFSKSRQPPSEENFRKIGLWKGGPLESGCFDSPRSSSPKKEIFFAENLKFFQSPGFFLSPSRKIADLANFKRILQIIDAPSLGIC